MDARWVVGIDGSAGSRVALMWSIAIARQRHERVAPLVAWHLPLSLRTIARFGDSEADRVRLRRAEAESVVADVTSSVETHAVIDAPMIVEGHPADVLVAKASSDDVIVVGRRGVSSVKHRLLGSVSHHLATSAEHPIVVVPETWNERPIEKIAVGFDGSDHAAAALRWAMEIAPAGSTVVAYSAVDLEPGVRPEVVEARHPDLVQAERERIDAALDAVDPTGSVERIFVLHGPQQAFSDIWNDVDMIVVGPRGLGGVSKMLLGSVSGWLLNAAPCPVAIVPAPQ